MAETRHDRQLKWRQNNDDKKQHEAGRTAEDNAANAG